MYVEDLNRRPLGQQERSRALEQMSRRVGKQKSRRKRSRRTEKHDNRKAGQQRSRRKGSR